MADLERLGKYEIRRELGRGAMGVVYEGYDPMIKRMVALKTIRADQLAGENAEIVIARFRREAQAAGRLSHPGIVSIYEFGEDEGIWYIAMEYVQGRELKDYFEANERFATADIVRIMGQMLDALGYSHKLGVIHRDIKPANVILLPDGGVKVADFGIAHIESSNMTQAGDMMGTPSYMSPEQIMGLPIDGRSDLFSAGVILYQFLTGERPFTGSATTIIHKVLEEQPLPPSRFNVQVPGAMDAVVRKALAKRPDERYQTAEEFAAAIREAAQASATSPLARSGAGAATIAPASGNLDPTVIAAAGAPHHDAAAPTLAPGAASAAPGAASAANATSTSRPSQTAAIAIVSGVAIITIAAGAWFFIQNRTGTVPIAAQSATASSATAALTPPASSAPAAAPPSATPSVAALPVVKPDNGSVTISATGLVDPTDARYASDQSALQTALRADSKSQLVEKALGLLIEPASLAKNYDLLKDKVLSQSGSYITTVVQEDAPRTGKDGLMSLTTQAVVNVKALQKSLNEMSRDERIELIRASGDPKVAVQIVVRDADQADAAAQPSPVAENLLKERIKSFGFRTWSADGARSDDRGADFDVQGEAQMRKLSMRLPSSGLTVTKYALTSWTVKCIDRATGEELYYNTALPKGLGSFASEGEALKAIGSKIADEFSRDFFLQHANVTGQKITVSIDGLPDATFEDALVRELVGLPNVIAATVRAPAHPRVYDIVLAGSGATGDLVANGALKALNAKLGQGCFSLGAIAGNQVAVAFDPRCGDASVLSRLETNPPASLYGAPPGRQKSVIKNPETLRKLSNAT